MKERLLKESIVTLSAGSLHNRGEGGGESGGFSRKDVRNGGDVIGRAEISGVRDA